MRLRSSGGKVKKGEWFALCSAAAAAVAAASLSDTSLRSVVSSCFSDLEGAGSGVTGSEVVDAVDSAFFFSSSRADLRVGFTGALLRGMMVRSRADVELRAVWIGILSDRVG
jgi:hypothetical protein